MLGFTSIQRVLTVYKVQVTSLSFSLESGDNVAFEGNVDPRKNRISRNSRVTQQRTNSVIEVCFLDDCVPLSYSIFHLLVQPFEVASLPLGLAEDGDPLSRSPLSLHLLQRSEAERVFLSAHRPLTSLRPSSVAAISDVPDFSSTTDLTPLSVVTFKEEKSQRNIWLDNASLMVGNLFITVPCSAKLTHNFYFQAMSLALCNIWRLPTFIYFNYSGKKSF